MKHLSIALIFIAALACDLVANIALAPAQSTGWDWTATIIGIWAWFAWRKS